MPDVSIITIFLDPGPFLAAAVDSVRGQTHESWELLLVDDGCTDGSDELARRWSRQDARIRYLCHPGRRNAGMSASRNLGLRSAVGEHVSFLDGDDVYLPGKLSTQLEILGRHRDADMVYGPMTLWYSWTGRPQDADRDRVRHTGTRLHEVIAPPSLLSAYLTGRASTPATCSVMLRRSALVRVGGFEEAFRGMFEDQVFFSKTALHLPCIVTDQPGDLYRQHPRSSSALSLQSGHWDRRRPNPARRAYLTWLESYLQDRGSCDPEVWAALRRELLPYRHPRRAAARAALGRVSARLRAAGRPS